MSDAEKQGDPLAIFAEWFAEARESEVNDPNAMVVASVGLDGMPSARMVLLKDYDEAGFVFYTNFESHKGRQILENPKVALLFHWKSLRRQVRIEGPVTEVDPEEADAYFASRPKQSRIGAWASDQSRPMQGRWELEKRVASLAAKYAVTEVPRPPHWSGFRVRPTMIEFWREAAFRLHDRLVFRREATESGEPAGNWRTERLFP